MKRWNRERENERKRGSQNECENHRKEESPREQGNRKKRKKEKHLKKKGGMWIKKERTRNEKENKWKELCDKEWKVCN